MALYNHDTFLIKPDFLFGDAQYTCLGHILHAKGIQTHQGLYKVGEMAEAREQAKVGTCKEKCSQIQSPWAELAEV